MSELVDNSLSVRALEVITGEYDDAEPTVKNVQGGYSRNRRAIVNIGNEEVFLKEVDVSLLPDNGEIELAWIKKDHEVIETLREFVPELIPEWSKLTMNGHLLVLPSYPQEKGWLWTLPADVALRHDYIDKVVSATQQLERVTLPDSFTEKLSLHPFFRDELAKGEAINQILTDNELRHQLITKFSVVPSDEKAHLADAYRQLVDTLKNDEALKELQARTVHLGTQPNDRFNHCDVRSDNIAYNPATGEVKFVDWNWASYAPSGFGATEFLADMARNGTDVQPWLDSLNGDLLAAMVGLYIVKSLKEPLTPTSTLREMQAETGAVSLQLFNLVR